MSRSTRRRPASPPPVEEEPSEVEESVLNNVFGKYITNTSDKKITVTILKRLVNDPNSASAAAPIHSEENKLFYPIRTNFFKNIVTEKQKTQLKQELGLPSTSTAAVSLRNISPPAVTVAPVSKRAKAPSPSKKSPSPPKANGEDVEMTPEKQEVYDVVEALMAARRHPYQPILWDDKGTSVKVSIDPIFKEPASKILKDLVKYFKFINFILFEYLFMKDTTDFNKLLLTLASTIEYNNPSAQQLSNANFVELVTERTDLEKEKISLIQKLNQLIGDPALETQHQQIFDSIDKIKKKYPEIFKEYSKVVFSLNKDSIVITKIDLGKTDLDIEDDLYKKAILTIAKTTKLQQRKLLYKYSSEILEWAQTPTPEYKIKNIYDFTTFFTPIIHAEMTPDQKMQKIGITKIYKDIFETFYVQPISISTGKITRTDRLMGRSSRSSRSAAIADNKLRLQVRGVSARVDKSRQRLHGGDEELTM